MQSAGPFVEQSFILVGTRRAGLWCARLWAQRLGSASAVEFNWRRALVREERRGDVIGWLHTHPPGLLQPSSRDVRTMRAWRSCFGKPLLCAIEADGLLVGVVFDVQGQHPLTRIARVEIDGRALLVGAE